MTEYYEWRVDRILLPDGRFGVVCYFRDIGDRKRAEQNANLLASIVESSDDAIVSKNLDGIIMSWNQGAERIFGYTAEEAVGQSILMLIPPDRLEEEPKILERLKRGERVEHFETIRVRKDGSYLNVSLTISPVRDRRRPDRRRFKSSARYHGESAPGGGPSSRRMRRSSAPMPICSSLPTPHPMTFRNRSAWWRFIASCCKRDSAASWAQPAMNISAIRYRARRVWRAC